MKGIASRFEQWFDDEVRWYKKIWRLRKQKRKRLRNEIIVSEKIKEAQSRAYITGRKHWVLKDFDGAIIVADRYLIHQFKRHGKLDKKASSIDLDREAIYTAWPPEKNKTNPTVKESILKKFFRLVLGW